MLTPLPLPRTLPLLCLTSLQIDYNQYYDSMRVADGEQQRQFYDFSLQSARVAQAKLREFLALMPADQVEAAREQAAAAAAAF